MHLDYDFLSSKLGLILLATQHNTLCWLSVGEDKTVLLDELQQQYPRAVLQQNNQLNPIYAQALQQYFADATIPASLPLAPLGTPWQQRIWQELQKIPSGQHLSYSGLAERCGKPKAARAAASACAQNPISLFIPCHRIIAKSGALGGYRWGLDKKQWLLNWEKKDRA